MQTLEQQLTCLPPALWVFLLDIECGHVVIHHGDSEYRLGPATIRRQRVRNLACISIEDLAEDNECPLHILGHLIDHHLGCRGEEQGRWLSDGGGSEPLWRAAGERLPQLFALGYGIDEIARRNVREYFAQSLAFYCRDRSKLNVADPQIDRWIRSTLFRRSFWRPPDEGQSATKDRQNETETAS